MKAGQITCRGLVEQYLRRIDAYDKNGPAINAIVVTNPQALAQADELDRRFKRERSRRVRCTASRRSSRTTSRPSACRAPTDRSRSQGFVSSKDAFQVKRIKDAGAIVLAKSNMAEWAFTPYETLSSILPGYTKNPYALDRVTAGSSGGTAASVAASFGAVGLGSDTGNSIRGPSSHQALVGIRSTMGLTSRAGVMPLNLLADIAGPMTRTVEDAAAVFQVVVGEDPDDPATAASNGRARENYAAALQRDGLKGARIGVLRQAYERDTTDPEIVAGVHDRGRGPASAPAPSSSIPRVVALDDVRRAAGRRPVHGVQVRHQPLPRLARRQGAGEEPGGDRQVGPLPPDGAATARAGRAGRRERPRHAGVQGRAGVSRACAAGGR